MCAHEELVGEETRLAIPRQDPVIRTVYGHVYSDLKFVLAILLIATSVCLAGISPGYSFTEEVVVDGDRLSFGATIAEGNGSSQWFDSDMRYLTGSIGNNDGKCRGLSGLRISMRLRREIRFLEHKINGIQDNPTYTHPALGFHVYDADATGWLHVLYKAVNIRRSILASHLDVSVADGADINKLSDGTPLYETVSGNVPEVQEIAETLDEMSAALPPAIFRDYKVYILPFSMGEISGLGSKGHMLLGTAPVNREIAETQTAFTVAHELGHHIHMTFLGATYEENPKGWDEYMRIRGIPAWTAGGDVNTQTWFRSTEETFAEDVRVLFGTPQAASEPHGTAYEDPRRDPVVAQRLRVFIDKHVDTC